MSTAYPVVTVQVIEICGLADSEITLQSLWLRKNLLFRHPENGGSVRHRLKAGWARAEDAQGRSYLIWEANHPRFRGLIIQPFDSCYCFELSPKVDVEGFAGSVSKKVVPLPGWDSQVKVP